MKIKVEDITPIPPTMLRVTLELTEDERLYLTCILRGGEVWGPTAKSFVRTIIEHLSGEHIVRCGGG